MANQKSRFGSSLKWTWKKHKVQAVAQSAQRRLRAALIEPLETRRVLAVGPQLIGIQPNASELLQDGEIRTTSPRELTFRFDQFQHIDQATLDGIRITSSGGDGTFGLASAQSDFGSGGKVSILLSADAPQITFEVQVEHQNLAPGALPQVGLSGDVVSIILNSNPASRSTALDLINAVNSSPAVGGLLTAQLHGGVIDAELGIYPAESYAPFQINETNDSIVQPGAILVQNSPRQNEVSLRFAERLADDNYRIEIFGYDDPVLGITGLRNVEGDLFQPSGQGTRSEVIDFRLDLGPQVISVVPQPVLRDPVDGLTQLRDSIVVYFNGDSMHVANDSQGRPTANSVENPEFYQLIYTAETVRNTDDVVELPTSVQYNAATNSVTLRFRSDINDLAGGEAGTFRLRVGSRESLPIAPTFSEAASSAFSDLNTNGLVKLRFTSKAVGESSGGVEVAFENSLDGQPGVSVSGNKILVDMGRSDLTAQQLVNLIRNSNSASALVSVTFEPGSIPGTVVGNRSLSYSPVTLVGLGGTFDTATDLGAIGSLNVPSSSLILSSTIDAKPFVLDLPGASDDAAHRRLPTNSDSFEDHVNNRFGADSTPGVSTVYYNFRDQYSTDANGNQLLNAISREQTDRVREVLGLWANYIGVQFVETESFGVTIATGELTGLQPSPGTELQLQSALGFGVRIDPSFEDSLVIMSGNRDWGVEYGDDFTRTFAAAFGMILGLEYAGDLPETTLLRLDPEFLSGSAPLTDPNDLQLTASDERYEPVFPGNQDLIHASFVHRPDSTDIDLFRFEVDLGDDQLGVFTAEAYARRLANSSSLDTNLELFRQIQASAVTNLGLGPSFSLGFEAVAEGALGNSLRIVFTQTERSDTSEPRISVQPNTIGIDLNSNPSMTTTIGQVVDALNQSADARRLVRAELLQGDANIPIGDQPLTQNPVFLSGGRIELVAQNDDYFSSDSFIRHSLGKGVYYVGVSASGNNEYDATVQEAGFGGRSQGDYELRLEFKANDGNEGVLQDFDGFDSSGASVQFDGDADGIAGGDYHFWFQTRPLNRSLEFVAGASSALEGQLITVVGANGIRRDFEFDSNGNTGVGRIGIPYSPADTAAQLATKVANAISARTELGVQASVNGTLLTLVGERQITVASALTQIETNGKTIFVDKSAGPNADGSLQNPFNNIARAGVPNAFASAQAGDIVRIVGNGGIDMDLTTIEDNFAYEIGRGLLSGSTLSDGSSMDVPQGVTVMVDAGAIFKLRQASVNVGSNNLNIDRSGSAIQVLGAPSLYDFGGKALRGASGDYASGNVYFTSWLDESIGFDNYAPTTRPSPGDWGGISLQRDIDANNGRPDLEDEGIFLRYVNHADIRYGGGTVSVNSIQTRVNPIQMLETRATVTDSLIQFSANAAMSALPDSFRETNFHEPEFQANGRFTSDYDRVGPALERNTLIGNSINGLFIQVDTPVDGSTQTLTVPARFDDTDIVHVFTENLLIEGNAGGTLLDNTLPLTDLVSLSATAGGELGLGTYNYKLTFVDANNYETVPSAATQSLAIPAGAGSISLQSLPGAPDGYVNRNLYRSSSNGKGPYELVAVLDKSSASYVDDGQSLGAQLLRDRAEVAAVFGTPAAGGSLSAGEYNYRVVMVDNAGREGLASEATLNTTVVNDSSIELTNLPDTLFGYSSRRIYRSSANGQAPYVLAGEIAEGTSSFLDDGAMSGGRLSPEAFGVRRPRLAASLVIDPGMVMKLEAARIEAKFGANIIAEGLDGLPIVFTSRLDDTVGAGGTFDTNNNAAANQPAPRDWGGIYMSPTSSLSVDHARFAFGGGVTKIEGTFRAFNTIEIHQADARIANSIFENNADGFGGQGPGTRFGRLSNAQSTIFVRGAQPTIIQNTFLDNAGSAIEIDVLSMNAELLGDPGRQTGSADQQADYATNRGPLIRGNRFSGNDLNGLEIRAGDILTTQSIWDDTDIVHVVTEEIFVTNVQHEGGLRLQSAPTESLVVKFDGYGSNFNDYMGAGITALGDLSTGKERVGGSLHVIGQPGFPVILTSLQDDTVGAGLRPDGTPQMDTNNDGIGSIPQSGDWRGLFLDQFSHDRNIPLILETEGLNEAAPGSNGEPINAQVLGALASSFSNSNERRQLGFVVEATLSEAADIDVFSFTATAGTDVWLDVDHTDPSSDFLLELLDAEGRLLARSDSSTLEALNPSSIVTTSLINPNSVGPLFAQPSLRTTSSGLPKEDGTTNVNDPGFRVTLPGTPGSRSTFFFRIRSDGLDVENLNSGLSDGTYQVQVRMQEAQEWAGSTVNYADIRYAMNGIHTRGLPGESPLIGEIAEDESVNHSFEGLTSSGRFYANNGTASGDGFGEGFGGFVRVGAQIGNRPQYIGNILATAKGGVSVAGQLDRASDLDYYQFEVRPEDVVGNSANGFASVVFDIDYADGYGRPDTSLNIFRQRDSFLGNEFQLIYTGDSSNIAEDQPRPSTANDSTDLSRGSAGNKDAYIGPVALQPGVYLVAVSSAAFQPVAKTATSSRVEPVNSVLRLVDTGFGTQPSTAEPPMLPDFELTEESPGTLISSSFGLGPYSAADLPTLYLDYSGQFEVLIREADGTETPIASANAGVGFTRIPLAGSNYNFAGSNDLQLVLRNASTDDIQRVIIGFAERGEQVQTAFEDEPAFVSVSVPPGTVTSGKYQLEMRLAENFFDGTLLTESFDTNYRFSQQLALAAPAGSDVTSGDRFLISDGLNEVVFQFTLNGNVQPGNVPVRFATTDSPPQIADAILRAISNPSVQSRFAVRAAKSSGARTAGLDEDHNVNLFGAEKFETLSADKSAGELQLIQTQGFSDSNLTRHQTQIIIQNSFIRESRDYGIWSEAAYRLADPRDDVFFPEMQDRPALVGTQAVRNLPDDNDSVQGGLLPGLVIQNNVLEEGGLGGVMLQGESPIWMLSPAFIPYFLDGDDPAQASADFNPTVNNAGPNPPPSHFGHYIDDGDVLVIDADSTRLRFEFEDLAGGPTGLPVAGSGQVEGDGYAADSSIVWYRDTGGDFYRRRQGGQLQPFGTSAFETVHALRDALLGSILVTNGTTQTITATVSESLLGPDPFAEPSRFFNYPIYHNRPALFIEGVANMQWQDGPAGIAGSPFDIRQLNLGEMPQPHARVVNNTIVGTDGRASFDGEDPRLENNDTIGTAVQTWQGTSHNPLQYSAVGIIGDGGAFSGSSSNGGGSSGFSADGGQGGGTGFSGDFRGAQYRDGRIIIRFAENVDEASRQRILASEGLEVVEHYERIDAVLVETGPVIDLLSQIESLNNMQEIRYAEPDLLFELSAAPNDPRFGEQWHYDNQGQSGGTIDADIDLVEAWDIFTGSSETVIAIIDSGVDYNHPDLQANMWVNPGEIAGDGIDNDGNGWVDDIYGIDPGDGDSDPMDTNGHGTHVAGTTAATGNNGIGVTGVNWDSKIMALKAGIGGSLALSGAGIVASIDYMTDMKLQYGVNVVVSNNSYGGPFPSQAIRDMIEASIDAGIVFVAAAGNDATDNDAIPQYPASYDLDGIITVASSDHNDQLSDFGGGGGSNFGLNSVDLAAPGGGLGTVGDVLSTLPGGGYGFLNGTSMASPHVAGVVALMAGLVPGATVEELKTAIMVGADRLDSLTGTSLTGGRLNAANSLQLIQDFANQDIVSDSDVDIYQFKLGIGERAIIDIDSSGSGLDSTLQIFDSRGVPQEFRNAAGEPRLISDNDPAPNEGPSLDPYADFTALRPGVYYAAVSSIGNTSFDPLSMANRQPGATSGRYRISVSARHLQDFVITAQDASAYSPGDTFTIFGVPDVGLSGNSGRTFEFVFGIGGPTNPNNIPININPDWRFPDVAVAIARAVNEGGTNRGPAITNAQQLPNGEFGVASPLPPVFARALGGISGVLHSDFNNLDGDKEAILELLGSVDGLGFNQIPDREIERILSGSFYEVNQGLPIFARRPDGNILTVTTTIPGEGTFTNIHTLSHLGIGHDRESTQPLSFTSRGDGASEKFVVINNAAWIDGNNTIIVDPDQGENHNLDQLLPETGVLATRGASPTILNNVFFNLQSPVITEESRINENTGVLEPFGTDNPDVVTKPGEVVVGGSVYQYYEAASADLRFGTGVQTVPTNVPNTQLDLNLDVGNGVRLFKNAQAGNYLPADGSPLIDSSVDSVPERPSLVTVKSSVGISPSPVLAPDYDLFGQLRTDDPDVAPPGGQGQNVFKDRGALERADFEGPAAILLDPTDNDAQGIDQDEALTVVQLPSGVYREFRIQLKDGNEPSNPLRGLGIDDSSVVNSSIEGLRLPGATLVLFENGRLLEEGIDYSFAYSATRDEIVLTPLAGVWRSNAIYEISLNNKDRFVVRAPAGDQVTDGDRFTVTDVNGGVSTFEFESGYQLQVPQRLTMEIPVAGGGNGGIADGDRFTISSGGQRQTFEFDRNGNTLPGNTPIRFEYGASQDTMAALIVDAIENSNLSLTADLLASGRVAIGASTGSLLETTFSAIDQPAPTLALKIPDLGPRPGGGITDGQTFAVSDGAETIIFEYDNDGRVDPAHQAIDFSSAITANDLASLTLQALQASSLNINPELSGPLLIYLGLGPTGDIDLRNSTLSAFGLSRNIADGENFTLTTASGSATFEFDTDGTTVGGNVAISISETDAAEIIGEKIADSITNAGLGLQPRHVGGGNVWIGGAVGDVLDASSAPTLTAVGTPGVESGTTLEVVGPLLLLVPRLGGGALSDNATFAITNNGQRVVFEFDSNFSGPSRPGNVAIPFNSLQTQDQISLAIVNAINGTPLRVSAAYDGAGRIDLGPLANNQLELLNSNLMSRRGVVSDGEFFTISTPTNSVSFEFANVDIGDGFDPSRIPIFFSATSTADSLVSAMKAAIESAGLGLIPTALPGGILQLNDTEIYRTNADNATSLRKSGVPGGAKPVFFIQDVSFTSLDIKQAILDAVATATNTPLVAKDRGGDTLFLENALTVSPPIESYFLNAITDLANNNLKPNRINDETEFTILMPQAALDFGDAPDPFNTTSGRYPTLRLNDGARHVVSTTALLGATIDAEVDGQPTPQADGDNDDGVIFGANLNTAGIFNPNIMTPIEVTLSTAGFVDAWIDFNADGDWDDPGEQILDSVRFTDQSLTQTFMVTVPATAPVPNAATITMARFRSSSDGGLVPTGLATDGEVEDYAVTIVPGTPPVANNDQYFLAEDASLTTIDADGSQTPGFPIDDGVAVNDFDPDGGTLAVELLTAPSFAENFTLNADGTFFYEPIANFNGTDTFTYRVNDGVLNSNNIGTVTITVTEVNDAPIARDDQVSTNEDVPLDLPASVLLANDDAGPDPNEDNQILRITDVDAVSAQGGAVSLVDGRVVYTPPNNFIGEDTFVYTITDNGTTSGVAAPLSASATVTVTVTDKNDPPIPGADFLTTAEDTPGTIAITTLLSNDLPGPPAESGQELTFIGVQSPSTNGGTVVVDGGNVIFTPAMDFVGTDTFFYEIEDNGSSGGVPDPARAIGTVTVTVTPVNDAPRVQNPMGEVEVDEDAPPRVVDLSNVFFDPDVITNGDVLTYSLISNSAPELVTAIVDGEDLQLTLLADQNGSALIVVEARDAAGETTTDTLTLTVRSVNDAPRLVQPLPDVNVDEGDADPEIVLTPNYFFDPDVITDGDVLTLAVSSNSNPLLVTPVIVGDRLVLQLAENRSGVSTITISATDEAGLTVTDTFNLIVNEVDNVPVTQPDFYSVPQGGTLITTDPLGLVGGPEDDGVLANDRDPEGRPLTAVLVSGPQFATSFTLNPNGTFTYEHDFDAGRTSDSFVYQASDGNGLSLPTTVTLSIGNPPPPPHQNPVNALDVNADGTISPIDALLVINFLNTDPGDGNVENLPPPPPYRDVDGNNFITALDALIVINELNAGSGSGEGEFAASELIGYGYPLDLNIGSQQLISSSSDNAHIGMRIAARNDQLVYGPLRPADAEIFGASDMGPEAALSDTSWIEEDGSDAESKIDSALASLLGEEDRENWIG